MIQLTLPRYRDSSSQLLVRNLIVALLEKHSDSAIKCLLLMLVDIASQHKNLVVTYVIQFFVFCFYIDKLQDQHLSNRSLCTTLVMFSFDSRMESQPKHSSETYFTTNRDSSSTSNNCCSCRN